MKISQSLINGSYLKASSQQLAFKAAEEMEIELKSQTPEVMIEEQKEHL